ncbi:MAG: PEP-utilizing enzyme, partial [Streptosporangiales bacterium]
SSVAEVGPADAAAAVRSCWASAFAVDPLGRLTASGLDAGDLRLGVVVQPEIRPDAGGVARVEWDEVIIDGVPGHPADLLGGWAEGATERWPLAAGAAGPPRGPLATLVGPGLVAAVARLARACHRDLGDDLIEWAACGDQVWLLQSRSTAAPRAGWAGTGGGRCPGPAAEGTRPAPAPDSSRTVPLPDSLLPAGPARTDPVLADPVLADPALADQLLAMLTAVDRPADPAARVRWMPFIATIVLARGQHVAGRPAAPGLAAGRLVPVRPHAPAAASHLDAVLLVDHPHPALAPLLFAARAVIARRGAVGSHLADVARSLGVPMVTGCPLDEVDPLDRPGGGGPGT